MFLTDVSNRGATPALINMMSFNEKRLEVISENVANATTPGYRAKQLDPQLFQQNLREALDRRDKPRDPFYLDDDGQTVTNDFGLLDVKPSLEPVDNALMHDGTNVSIEKEMIELAETALAHEMASEMLRGRYEGLRKAIRGSM